jgi:hypothetical protein
MKREPCPYCHLDAGTGPWAHATKDECIKALKAKELEARTCLQMLFVKNSEKNRDRAWAYLYPGQVV